MSSDKKERATRFQERHRVVKEERPVYHATPPTGWMNDPNGFSQFGGKIHLFYQYHPYKDIWGPMHWGHCMSDNYLKWEDLPVALAPDEDYDMGGCFSGSAIEKDGQQVLIYTGCARREPGKGPKQTAQQQCLAAGDGLDYVKDAQNPVIPTSMLPEGFRDTDFRDPKIWEWDGQYWIVTVAMDKDGMGHVLVYKSADLRSWEFVSIAASSDGTYGNMWECPDLFTLDGTDTLMLSCMHMQKRDPKFHDGYGVIVCTGEMDWDSGRMNIQNVDIVDQGADFYASQSFETNDGRRIMIAWMQAWENFIKPVDQKWHGMMCVPREIRIVDGILKQEPVREIEAARVRPVTVRNAKIAGPEPVEIPDVHGRAVDLTVTITEADCREFTIGFAQTDESGITFTWRPEDNEVICRREPWGMAHHVTDKFAEQTLVLPVGTPLPVKLRFLVDTASVELFAADGAAVLSTTYYAPGHADSIQLSCDGSVTVDIDKYDIDPGKDAES